MKKALWLVPLLGFVGCAPKPAKIDPPMTVRELRKEVDPAVRWVPEDVPANQNGWDLAKKAAQLCPKDPQPAFHTPVNPGDFDSAKEPPKQGESVNDILTAMDKPGEKNLRARAEKVLKPYGPALEMLAAALAKPRWVAPEPRDDVVPNVNKVFALDTFSYAGAKELAKALILRARLDLMQSRPTQAASDFALAEAVARHLIACHADMMSWLTGISTQRTVDRAVQLTVRDPVWTVASLRRLLNKMPDTRTGVDYVLSMRHEFDSTFLGIVAGLGSGPEDLAVALDVSGPGVAQAVLAGHPDAFDRRDTVRRASARLALLAECASKPWDGRWEAESILPIEIVPELPESLLSRILAAREDASDSSGRPQGPSAKDIADARAALRKLSNPVGKMLIADLSPVRDEELLTDRQTLATVEATRITLALAVYRRTHGSEARALQDLMDAGLLAAVPMDPFGRGPFHYDSKRRVFWSVGPNGIDDGGYDAPTGVSRRARDYVWPSEGSLSH
jgi:hypothetical protein